MPKIEAKISVGYQITVPSAVRKLLNVEPGDKLVFDTEMSKVTVAKAETREEKVKRVFRELDKWRDGLSDEQKAKIKKYAGWTANQYREHIDNLPETKAYWKERYGV